MSDASHTAFSGPFCGAIHGWFGLSYANFLVLPRLVMQNMPDEWQRRFVELMEQYDLAATGDGMLDAETEYVVMTRDSRGRLKPSMLADYRRGDIHALLPAFDRTRQREHDQHEIDRFIHLAEKREL